MGQGEKRLADMRRNPRDGWRIEDIQVICSEFGILLKAPNSGSHFKVTHPSRQEILTIPAKRPVKPVYVKQFVAFVDLVRRLDNDN
jgi:hypothetical protein